MKSKQKIIFVGIIGFAIAIILFGIYTIWQVSGIAKLSAKTKQASEITQAVLEFGHANAHLQCKLWEYGYDPIEKRFKAFSVADVALHNHLEDLIKLSESEENYRLQNPGKPAAISSGGLEKVMGIEHDVEKLHADRVALLEALKKLQELNNLEDGADVPVMASIKENTKQSLILHGVLFNALEFHESVHKFIEGQEDLVWRLHIEQKSLIANFFISFGVLLALLVVFNATIVVMLIKFPKV